MARPGSNSSLLWSANKRRKAAATTGGPDRFRRFAQNASIVVGSPWAFLVAFTIIVGWAICGPIFSFSDTWQLIINTSTTIVTFLMVFLIQNTQNRDARAMHLKLDELIRGVHGARTRLVDLEEMSDAELDALQEQFRRLHRKRGSRRSRARKTAEPNH